MNPTTPLNDNPEPDPEITPHSAHARMPWFLLVLWLAGIVFFFYYFIRFGWPDLQRWLGQ